MDSESIVSRNKNTKVNFYYTKILLIDFKWHNPLIFLFHPSCYFIILPVKTTMKMTYVLGI